MTAERNVCRMEKHLVQKLQMKCLNVAINVKENMLILAKKHAAKKIFV